MSSLKHAAALVRLIFAERAAGATLRDIAEQVNHKQPVSPWGGRWHTPTVHEVLQSDAAYRGGQRGARA